MPRPPNDDASQFTKRDRVWLRELAVDLVRKETTTLRHQMATALDERKGIKGGAGGPEAAEEYTEPGLLRARAQGQRMLAEAEEETRKPAATEEETRKGIDEACVILARSNVSELYEGVFQRLLKRREESKEAESA